MLGPVARSERYRVLDALRGLALFGVLIINLLTLFRVSLVSHILGTDVPPDRIGTAIYSGTTFLLEFKAFTLFSFLFGAGVALQAGRSAGSAASFLLRRFSVLLCIGLVHLLLIWNGDILTLYAICGILLIPLLRLPNSILAAIGAGLIIANYYAPLPELFPSQAVLSSLLTQANHVYSAGTFMEITRFRCQETSVFIGPLLALVLPRTLGVMMLGVAAWRSRLFFGPRSIWWLVLSLGGAVGAAGTLTHQDIASVPLALSYAAAALLFGLGSTYLAAAGQMALTNYLFQSFVFGFVFYGYGLGLFARMGETETFVGGVFFYLVQLLTSKWWLRRFEFGPAEWLWRSLTYGRRQPMRRRPEPALTASGS
jgi:uncharacterized protein